MNANTKDSNHLNKDRVTAIIKLYKLFIYGKIFQVQTTWNIYKNKILNYFHFLNIKEYTFIYIYFFWANKICKTTCWFHDINKCQTLYPQSSWHHFKYVSKKGLNKVRINTFSCCNSIAMDRCVHLVTGDWHIFLSNKINMMFTSAIPPYKTLLDTAMCLNSKLEEDCVTNSYLNYDDSYASTTLPEVKLNHVPESLASDSKVSISENSAAPCSRTCARNLPWIGLTFFSNEYKATVCSHSLQALNQFVKVSTWSRKMLVDRIVPLHGTLIQARCMWCTRSQCQNQWDGDCTGSSTMGPMPPQSHSEDPVFILTKS